MVQQRRARGIILSTAEIHENHTAPYYLVYVKRDR